MLPCWSVSYLKSPISCSCSGWWRHHPTNFFSHHSLHPTAPMHQCPPILSFKSSPKGMLSIPDVSQAITERLPPVTRVILVCGCPTLSKSKFFNSISQGPAVFLTHQKTKWKANVYILDVVQSVIKWKHLLFFKLQLHPDKISLKRGNHIVRWVT